MALIATFSIFTILLIIMFPLILNIVTSVWAYRDAIRRGNSKEYALIVLVATLVFPIVGLLVYLIIRKD